MRKGIVFTMDAILALYIALLFMSIMMVLLETNQNYSNDSLSLARLSRDVFEVRKYNPSVTLPSFIATGSACSGKGTIGSVFLVYSDIQTSTWNTQSGPVPGSEKVCMNG
jgi:hypothetical protein